MKKYAIIVAGGKGLRMGAELPKQFLPLASTPVLMHTMRRFYSYDPTITLILVLPQSQIPFWQSLCVDHAFTLPHQVVEGGESRFHSVQNGLAAVAADGVVAVHDGVRPFVSEAVIAEAFSVAMQEGAAIPVLPLVDSLRRVDEGSSYAEERANYRLVQTPQVFRVELLKRAYDTPFKDSFTDDASVVEAAGYAVCLTTGNSENIKITTPFDLLVARTILDT